MVTPTFAAETGITLATVEAVEPLRTGVEAFSVASGGARLYLGGRRRATFVDELLARCRDPVVEGRVGVVDGLGFSGRALINSSATICLESPPVSWAINIKPGKPVKSIAA
jgi:hypothetical protein